MSSSTLPSTSTTTTTPIIQSSYNKASSSSSLTSTASNNNTTTINPDTIYRVLRLGLTAVVIGRIAYSWWIASYKQSSSSSASSPTSSSTTTLSSYHSDHSHHTASSQGETGNEDKENIQLHETTLYEVEPYTQLDLSTLEYIFEEFYNLGNVTGYRVLKGGLSNSNYRIDTDASPYTVLLKVCDNKYIDELRIQVRALNILKEYHIPIAYPVAMPKQHTSSSYTSPLIRSTQNDTLLYDDIPNAPLNKRYSSNDSNASSGSGRKHGHVSSKQQDDTDRYILQLPGYKPIILYDYIHGDWVRNPTPAMLSDVGIALAKLHSVPISRFTDVKLPPFPMGLIAIQPMLGRIKGTQWESHEFVGFLKKHIDELIPILDIPLPQSVCHFDLFVQNVMFAGQKLLAFIDMEEMGIGAAILDVAMAICGMCYDADDTFDIPLVQSFLKAYTSQRKLTSTERDLLPSYLIYACLGIGAWRFENFNITHPDDIRSDSYLSMMRRINNIDADLLKSLC